MLDLQNFKKNLAYICFRFSAEYLRIHHLDYRRASPLDPQDLENFDSGFFTSEIQFL